MYHSWGAQNAWLRQITSQNRLFVHHEIGRRLGLVDDDWVWIESHHARVKGQIRLIDGVNTDTVWTWNAIGKRRGAWMLGEDTPETTHGFLLNHAISDILPGRDGRQRSNSDPVTGQAAWFDLRVRLIKCTPAEAGLASPQFPQLKAPGLPRPAQQSSFGAQFRRRREAAH
jgi:anaerobic selenocysteine-containing dehydrogenase